MSQWIINPHSSAGRERIYEEFGRGDPERIWRKEADLEWIPTRAARQAIPPAYTELIGHQLMQHLEAKAAA